MQRLRVPYAFGAASHVRHRLVSELTAARLPAVLVDDVALVVSELVGNALRHGEPLVGGGIGVTWEIAGDRLRLEVEDGGSGPPCYVREPAVDSEGGRGLLLVDAVSGEWGVRHTSDGCAVWVDLRVNPGVPLTPAVRAGHG